MPQNDHNDHSTSPPGQAVSAPPGAIPVCVMPDCTNPDILCECHHCPNCQHGDIVGDEIMNIGPGSVRGALRCLVSECGCLYYQPLTEAYLPLAPDSLANLEIDLLIENMDKDISRG